MTLSELYKNEGWELETKIYLLDKRSGRLFKWGKAEDIIPQYGNKKIIKYSQTTVIINK